MRNFVALRQLLRKVRCKLRMPTHVQLFPITRGNKKAPETVHTFSALNQTVGVPRVDEKKSPMLILRAEKQQLLRIKVR